MGPPPRPITARTSRQTQIVLYARSNKVIGSFPGQLRQRQCPENP